VEKKAGGVESPRSSGATAGHRSSCQFSARPTAAEHGGEVRRDWRGVDAALKGQRASLSSSEASSCGVWPCRGSIAAGQEQPVSKPGSYWGSMLSEVPAEYTVVSTANVLARISGERRPFVNPPPRLGPSRSRRRGTIAQTHEDGGIRRRPGRGAPVHLRGGRGCGGSAAVQIAKLFVRPGSHGGAHR